MNATICRNDLLKFAIESTVIFPLFSTSQPLSYGHSNLHGSNGRSRVQVLAQLKTTAIANLKTTISQEQRDL